MAGTIKSNILQLGDSTTATQNAVLQTNIDGTFKLARGNAGATSQDILTVDANGRVAMPQSVVAFSAYQSAVTSIANSAWAKVALQNKSTAPSGFDTGSYFDNATNFRFQPLVAGYYQINGSVAHGPSATGVIGVSIYRNGVSSAKSFTPNNSLGIMVAVSALVYLNGSTDYIELWGYQNSGGSLNTDGTVNTVMSGILVAKA